MTQGNPLPTNADSGRLNKITDFDDRTVTYEYDAEGDLQKVKIMDREKSYTYTDDGLLNTVTYPRGNAVTYGYNNGLITEITETPTSEGFENTEYLIEAFRKTSFNYNNKRNLESIVYPGGLTQNYTYNDYGQLTSERASFGSEAVPLGIVQNYGYHPETNPGGGSDTPPESPRTNRNNETGGYLNYSSTSFSGVQDP